MKSSNQCHWAAVIAFIIFAVLAMFCGWLVPSHMRAVDAAVVQRAGEHGSTLVDRGLILLRANNPDAARLILQASQTEKDSRARELASALALHPESERLFPNGPAVSASTPVTTFVLRLENRESVLAYLQANDSPSVRELLRTRNLTNTVLFPPSSSSSGQAFDAAVSVTGLLLAENHLAAGLREALLERAASAQTKSDAQPLEEILMDLMSLGQRFDWGQLSAFVSHINSPATLSLLASQTRNAGSNLPELFSAVVLTERPDQVSTYLNDYTKTGMADITASLPAGQGGVDELLQGHLRLYDSTFRQKLTNTGPFAPFFRAVSDYALRVPWFAQMVKWFFYMLGGFFLAVAFHFGRPGFPALKQTSQPPGFKVIRNLLFSLGFLFVVLLLSEPFLAQENQKAAFAFRLRLPGAAAVNLSPLDKSKPMQDNDPKNLLTLLLFFVLQAIIYSVCLAKLSEIRRQNVPARVQLKLLENEEHLFDAGLYVGFAGTIVCLILISMKYIQQQSLMAAYSSTSFGIIFVSIFKIFNLRPVRRRLVMQAEAQAMISEKTAPAAPAMAPIA